MNCLHTLPVLARAERELRDEPVAFVGVHSPKFTTEQDEANVREAVRRYGVTHPVVVDSQHRTWRAYGVRAWPTLLFVDPLGDVIGEAPGEPDADSLVGFIRELLEGYRARGVPLAKGPPPFRPEPAVGGALAYPGKLCAWRNRLYVADTGHHQVVELELTTPFTAREVRRFGAGAPGSRDGENLDCELDHPNGLGVDAGRELLWVADTGSHTVRSIELSGGRVETRAGDGEKGAGALRPDVPFVDASFAIRSPWDVTWDAKRERLYVAMAGSHQLYELDPAAKQLRVLAGSGREAREDGPAARACFAQPSGTALLGEKLYVADSEISAVRELDLATGQVRTVCGGDLFDFGDADGVGDAVRMQHPLGLCTDGVRLFVADAFNHKVKAVTPAGAATSLYGNGEPLRAALEADQHHPTLPSEATAREPMFFEPEGVCVHGGVLYVADTNNHRVVGIELATGKCARVFGGE